MGDGTGSPCKKRDTLRQLGEGFTSSLYLRRSCCLGGPCRVKLQFTWHCLAMFALPCHPPPALLSSDLKTGIDRRKCITSRAESVLMELDQALVPLGH